MKRIVFLLSLFIPLLLGAQDKSSAGFGLDPSDAQAVAAMRARMDQIRKHRPTVALVLSGGGAKGAATVGALKYLEQYKFPIDMVVVNLYPFQQTVAKDGVTPEMARTNIDIGGPCMVRASAKNYLRVASVTDPLDYPNIVQELESHGGSLGLDTRFKLMKKAFTHTAEYDTAISKFFTTRTWEEVEKTYNLH